MSKPVKENSNKKEKSPRKGAKAKTSEQIVGRHIRDKNDVITDEEFKDLNVGTDVPVAEEQEPLELPKGNKRPKDEDKDPEILTPWDLIK